MALVTIHLGGKLGAIFGKKWQLDVSSPAEALRAIDINVKGRLREYLTAQGDKKFYKIALAKKDNLLGKEELDKPSGKSDIYVLPTIKGNSTGWGKIVAAVAIVAILLITQQYWAIPKVVVYAAASAAASLAIGGIVQLVTPVPNFNQNGQGDSRGEGSTLFQGNSTTISQGGAVGLVYGRALVIPMPISISYDNTDTYKPANAIGDDTYNPIYGPGGEVQFVRQFP